MPPGLGLPPGHPYNALYADSLMAAQQHQQAEMYAREAQRAAELQKGLDMHRYACSFDDLMKNLSLNLSDWWNPRELSL